MVSLVDSDAVKVGVVQCNSQLEIWKEGKVVDMVICLQCENGYGKTMWDSLWKRELTCLSKQGNIEDS
jgi:hypothetical protein